VSLADITEQNRAHKAQMLRRKRERREQERRRVWAAADAVFLAAYQQQPQPVIDELMARLAAATGAAV
jgi:hypothetical protein